MSLSAVSKMSPRLRLTHPHPLRVPSMPSGHSKPVAEAAQEERVDQCPRPTWCCHAPWSCGPCLGCGFVRTMAETYRRSVDAS